MAKKVISEGDVPVQSADDYYAGMLLQKIAAGLSKEDAETVVKWQREEDEKNA